MVFNLLWPRSLAYSLAYMLQESLSSLGLQAIGLFYLFFRQARWPALQWDVPENNHRRVGHSADL